MRRLLDLHGAMVIDATTMVRRPQVMAASHWGQIRPLMIDVMTCMVTMIVAQWTRQRDYCFDTPKIVDQVNEAAKRGTLIKRGEISTRRSDPPLPMPEHCRQVTVIRLTRMTSLTRSCSSKNELNSARSP